MTGRGGWMPSLFSIAAQVLTHCSCVDSFRGVVSSGQPNTGYLHQVVGSNFDHVSLSWPQESVSLAVLLVAIIVLALSCCCAVLLVAAACCGSRRRDTVAEGSDTRWLPGVGAIDYVPPSERSSVRVSLILEEPTGTEANNFQFTLPLLPSSTSRGEYRPFREALDTPDVPLLDPGRQMNQLWLGSSTLEFSEDQMRKDGGGGGGSKQHDGDTLRGEDGMDGSLVDGPSTSSSKQEFCRTLDETRGRIRREKRSRQLMKEIEMIEMKLMKNGESRPTQTQTVVRMDFRTFTSGRKLKYQPIPQHGVAASKPSTAVRDNSSTDRSERKVLEVKPVNKEKMFKMMWNTFEQNRDAKTPAMMKQQC